MTITKLGHCCLLIKLNGVRILTDPGMFTVEAQSKLTNLDAILITHEHSDHFHVESVKAIITNNPNVRIITNAAVGKLLEAEVVKAEIAEHRQATDVNSVTIEGFGSEHAEIYHDWKRVPNTGYLIAGRFFYPGDAFTKPGKPVEVLALPVAGPWVKIKEAIDYTLELKPKIAFPVHDGMLSYTVPTYATTEHFLTTAGIAFIIPKLGTSFEPR